jgi:hypothetical protein
VIPALRERFNREYDEARHRQMCAGLADRCGVPIEFRLSETPCFLPGSVARRLVETSQVLIAQLLDNPEYLAAAETLVPPEFHIRGGEPLPTFVQVDFGIVRTPNGIEGRLVEMQAFPSLYGFQMLLAEASRDTWGYPALTPFFEDLTRQQYIDLVGRAIVGSHDPAEVVLLEIDPDRQKTRPDFTATESIWGVRGVDLRSVEREGRRLYARIDGRRTPIRRIYNRVIPDDLAGRGLSWPFAASDELDVEWTGGPDWFCRISKYSLPWLDHPWVPRTRFLTDVASLPAERDAWVLKPLLSFAGSGIAFAPTDEQLAAIPDSVRSQFVVQERVSFTPLVDTPHGPTQVEVRVMLVRDGDRYRAVLPLGRMGRGLMMGVDHNRGLEWVGAAAILIDGSC